MQELAFNKVGWAQSVNAESPENLTAESFISEVIKSGFKPIESTIYEDDNFFYVFCEKGYWLRGAK